MTYVKKLGVYSGVMVYALYPSQSMLEDLRGQGWRYWLENLVKWFVRGIQSSSYLYKILTSAEPFPLPRVRYGEEEKREMLSLWARTLDALIICKTRAWYSIKRQKEGIIKPVPHIEIRTSEESKNIEKNELIRNLIKGFSGCLLKEIEPLYKIRIGNVVLRGRPDLYLMSKVGNVIRGIIIEIGESSFSSIKRTWHTLPRLYIYGLSTFKQYGIPHISFYIPLSMGREFAVLALVNSRLESGGKPTRIPHMTRLIEEINQLSELAEPPAPYTMSRLFCNECEFKTICRHSQK